MTIKIITQSGKEHLIHTPAAMSSTSVPAIEKIRDQLVTTDELLTIYEKTQLKAIFVKKFIESISVCEE